MRIKYNKKNNNISIVLKETSKKAVSLSEFTGGIIRYDNQQKISEIVLFDAREKYPEIVRQCQNSGESDTLNSDNNDNPTGKSK